MSSPVLNSMFKLPDLEVAKLAYCHFCNSCMLTSADSWYLAAELPRVCIAAVQRSRAGRLGQESDKVGQAEIGGTSSSIAGWRGAPLERPPSGRTSLFVWTEPLTFRRGHTAIAEVFLSVLIFLGFLMHGVRACKCQAM